MKLVRIDSAIGNDLLKLIQLEASAESPPALMSRLGAKGTVRSIARQLVELEDTDPDLFDALGHGDEVTDILTDLEDTLQERRVLTIPLDEKEKITWELADIDFTDCGMVLVYDKRG